MWLAAGIAFLVTGTLEILFLGLCLLGTVSGAVMTAGTIAGELRHEEALIGPILLLFYGLWFAATLVAGPLHIAAGVSMVTGGERRKLVWAATIVSVLPVATVYCAPTSMVAGVLALVALLTPKK